MTIRPANLRRSVSALTSRPHADVLIIGGGINGIATFRELALQGIDVALVERADYVSGASAASSHMIHGGIRYLENGEFRLVKESVQERNRLIRNAPHYVHPLRTTIPIFSTLSGILAAPFRLLITHGRGRPRERGALLIKVGLMIYDTFSRSSGRVPRHKFHGKRKSLRELPRLNRSVKYTATYFDASMHDPERLALDVLYDGVAAGNVTNGDASARAANYVEASSFVDGSVILRDSATGTSWPFSARVVVNTSGPWTDITNEALGLRTAYMGGTKGSHVVLDNPDLLAATGGREIFFEHSDGRVVLIYPLKGRVMVGTTDIAADPREPSVLTNAEVSYFVDLVAHVFPDIPVTREQIVFSFSGIRPLPRHDDTLPGFISRDYRIEHNRLANVHLLSLVGGKWTTFRALAEHLGDEAMQLLGTRRRVSTRATVIGGGAGFPAGPAARRIWVAKHGSGHSQSLVERMLERYGTNAAVILERIPVDSSELSHVPGYFAEEIAHLARSEDVLHLDDVILRRTSIAFHGGLTEEALAQLADVAGEALRWDNERRSAEIARTTKILRDTHRVILGEKGLAS